VRKWRIRITRLRGDPSGVDEDAVVTVSGIHQRKKIREDSLRNMGREGYPI
jgi:hypothetical protein